MKKRAIFYRTADKLFGAMKFFLYLLLYFLPSIGFCFAINFFSAAAGAQESDTVQPGVIFQLGRPDGFAKEFRREGDWAKRREELGEEVVVFRVGQNRTVQWPPIHLSTRDYKAANLTFTYTLEFDLPDDQPELADRTCWFHLGIAFTHPSEYSLVHLKANQFEATPQRFPAVSPEKYAGRFNSYVDEGGYDSLIFEIPPGTFQPRNNRISLTLTDGSWLFYDYLLLNDSPEVPERLAPKQHLAEFRANGMSGVNEILFARRKPGTDPHWYANFGYYAMDTALHPFPLGSGGALEILRLDTGEVRTLFEDQAGNIRDPVLDYDATKVFFSYLAAGTEHYHLYEIGLDGQNLRQLTDGAWDDIEPCPLPNGDLVFISSRCQRWVQCWLTSVATLYRCDGDGSNPYPISANLEHDNTPAILPDGRILYTRWEYIDRSQVHYHHLWSVHPDGTQHAAWFGNQKPGIVMIDAKPIPNSDKIAAIFSPGHGRTEHYGQITVVDPKRGPDEDESVVPVGWDYDQADVWPFSEKEFMAVRHDDLLLVDDQGNEEVIWRLPEEQAKAGFWIHEPRPILPRSREPILADLPTATPKGICQSLEQGGETEQSGSLLLMDIYAGRRMKDVPRGSVAELLVLEPLPEPIHYNGGMQQISYGGTFTLVRNVGTVPVTPEGSAWFRLPANRAFFFVALDAEKKPIKRMHSFTSLMPGETASCIGCHEERTQAPADAYRNRLFEMMKKEPLLPTPIPGIPEVFDFPRDIQPILDRHCLECHNEERTEAGVNLSGDWAVVGTFSYHQLSWRNLLGDNRNRPQSDFGPYEIGSCQSRLYGLICEGHEGVKLSDEEKKIVRHWLEAGANFAGTYAANASGVLAWSDRETPVRVDVDWPETAAMKEVVARRCAGCHTPEWKNTVPDSLTGHANLSAVTVFNLSRPERSLALLSPLAREAGGLGRCRPNSDEERDRFPLFTSTEDPDYHILLAAIERGRDYILHTSNRFTMKPFVPNGPYVREMIRYGVLPPDHDTTAPIDPYETDRRYWENCRRILPAP